MFREINLITGNRFFTGQSDQEKAAEAQYKEIGSLDPNVENRFDNYENPYGYEDMSSKIEEVFGGYEDKINRETEDRIKEQQQGAASAMASRGITGGSILSDTQGKVASDVNRSKTNALSNLGISKSSALSNLMEYFNSLKLGTTKAASDVDFGNMRNTFTKYGLKTNALGGLDDDTWLDDTLGIFNAVGNVARGIGSIAGGGGGTAGGAT